MGIVLAATLVWLAALAGAATASPLGEIEEWPTESSRCVAVGSDGNAWFSPTSDAEGGPAIGRITPAGVLTRFHEGLTWDHDMKRSSARCLYHRPDGNLWFNDYSAYGAGGIGRITMSGEIDDFKGSGLSNSYLFAAVGPDGTMWYYQYEFGQGEIGRVALDGTFEDFTANKPAQTEAEAIFPGLNEDAYYLSGVSTPPYSVGYVSPSGYFTTITTPSELRGDRIAIAADDTLWGTASAQTSPTVVGPALIHATHTAATEFNVGLNPGADPQQIVAGPGESMWFVDRGTTPAIGKVTAAGAITEYSTGLNTGADPAELLVGPEGDIWFTDVGTTPAIGRVTPAGEIAEYSVGLNLGAKPRALTVGVEGNLWFFDEGSTRAIGRVTPEGSIEEWSEGLDPTASIQSSGANAQPLAVGPGGNVWLMNHPAENSAAVVRIGTEEPEGEGGEEGGTGEKALSSGGGSGQGAATPHGDPLVSVTSPAAKPKRCRKGFRKGKLHGKTVCVKVRRHRHRHRVHRPGRVPTRP